MLPSMSQSWTTERQLLLRQIAVARMIEQSESAADVAESLGVSVRSAERWCRAWRLSGEQGLVARPRSGRPPKLDAAQEAQVLGWIRQSPTLFGFVTEQWTAPRVAQLIENKLGVQMHPRYLNAWLSQRRITPQIPRKVPRERDEALIDWWVRREWPRLKKTRDRVMQPLLSATKAGF
jgi:transposase